MILDAFTDYQASEAVSFSRLKVFDQNPLLYYKYFIERSLPDREETKAMRVGSAAHCLILEGPGEFAKRFAIRPKVYTAEGKDGPEEKAWNLNAKLCQAWVALAESTGRTVITVDELATLTQLRDSVLSNPDAVGLLEHGQAELAIRRDYPAIGLTIQGRLDWWIASGGVVVDLKTIENLDDLRAEIERRNYYRQLAFYRSLAQDEFAVPNVRCAIIGVEKSSPWRCGVYWLREDLLAIGDAYNLASLCNLARCKASGDWGGNPATVEIGPSADLIWSQMESDDG